MRRPGLTGAAHCNELVILTVRDDTLTMHRTNFNSYIRHKSEFRIMPENFTIRHSPAHGENGGSGARQVCVGAAFDLCTGVGQRRRGAHLSGPGIDQAAEGGAQFRMVVSLE